MAGGSCPPRAGADTRDRTRICAFPQTTTDTDGDGLERRILHRPPEAVTPTAAVMQDRRCTCRVLEQACGRVVARAHKWNRLAGLSFLAVPPTPPANAAGLDDLADALTADAEGLCTLAHRSPRRVQASDRSGRSVLAPGADPRAQPPGRRRQKTPPTGLVDHATPTRQPTVRERFSRTRCRELMGLPAAEGLTGGITAASPQIEMAPVDLAGDVQRLGDWDRPAANSGTVGFEATIAGGDHRHDPT